MHIHWSIILHRLQHRKLVSLRHFGLLLVLFDTVWLGLPALPVYATSQESWDNAWTHTTSIYAQPYKSVIYSMPQVVDVGEGFVEYNIERVKLNEYWVDCPTSSFNIRRANTEVWSVNRTEQRLSKCIWQLWAFNGSAWIEIEESESTFSIREAETSASLEHYRVMEDESLFNVTWTFDNRAKASVSFKAGETRAYAITWHVESPKATTEIIEGETITFLDGSEWLTLLDYHDASMFHNQTEVSALGATGRKARVIFVNQTFLAGENIRIDPVVDSFDSEATRDGYLYRKDNFYPPTTTYKDTSSQIFKVGQANLTGGNYTYRGFLSFNTSTVNQTATIAYARLDVCVFEHYSNEFYNIKLYSGHYGTSLNKTDWDLCTSYEGILCTSSDPNYWHEITVSASAINNTGLTQFKLTSNRQEEALQPTSYEYSMLFTGDDSTYYPTLNVYYEQEEEDEDTKGEGTEDGTTGGARDPLADIVSATKQELSVRGLYWLGGFLILIVVGGVYAGRKTKRLSRKATGKTGGGGSPQPRGTPKKRSRDARGRFK